jgi:radical SAM superfamily enzyme YgiQ (UPF0313 family)
MHYAKNIYRPPVEDGNVYLQVTKGCTHNSCTFCTAFPDDKFRVSPLEEIIEDLEEVKRYRPGVNRLFLLNGDPFALSYEKLANIANLIKTYLPNCNSISMYARVSNIKNKSIEELRHLRSLGITDLYIGVETANNYGLKMANKGYTPEDILEQCGKLELAGIEYTAMLIAGLSGKGYSEDSAKNNAKIFNQLNPKTLALLTLFILEGSELEKMERNGEFFMASEYELIKENLVFMKEYEFRTKELKILVTPNSSPITMRTKEDKDNVVKHVNEKLENFTIKDEQQLRSIRNSVKNM